MAQNPKIRHLRYETLRRKLQESVDAWPSLYEHKIIGKNVDEFNESLKTFEETFPRLNRKTSNLSRNSAYLSITYEILARDVDEIIVLWVESEKLRGFVTVI